MIDCPICKGTGKLDSPKDLGEAGEKRHTAKLMREQGHSIRAIMKALNYKSPAAVQYLLDDSEKAGGKRSYNRSEKEQK